MKKKFVAVDEASRFKEDSSQRTIALFGGRLQDGTHSPGLVYDSIHSVLLDGSPMPNRPMELWAPTIAMNPEAIDFMSKQDFGFRYCGAQINERGVWEFKHSSNEIELKNKIQKDFMHVVSEEKLSHPERRRKMIFMTKSASPEVRDWGQKYIDGFGFEISESSSQGDLASLRHKIGEEKIDFIVEYTLDRLKKNEQILLFIWHRKVGFEILKQLSKSTRARLIMGDTQSKIRESVIEKFQNKEVDVIIGNILAMGRGHNLQAADRCIFGEFSWTDETNKQAEKRASRKGSEKLIVPCDYIVLPNSIDEVVLTLVFRKELTIKKVIG